jgi:hypothetical protein
MVGGNYMSKLRKYTIVILIIIVIAIPTYSLVINPWMQKDQIEEAIIKHLKERGYSQNDYSLSVNFHWENKLFGYDQYRIKVIYQDEPDVNYLYSYRNKQIFPNGIAPTRERDNKDFQHVE